MIEGEVLDKNSLRSSIAQRLGLPNAGMLPLPKHKDGIIEILLDATVNYASPLTEERLFGWQAALFPVGFSGIYKIDVGCWRTDKSPMQVVSGYAGQEKVHYEAPPSDKVAQEITKFLLWWNLAPQKLDGLIRAAVAHFWFVSIHPFADGNGRIARAITNMAIAQDEKIKQRFYSLSSQILSDKENYYSILENTQQGGTNITPWITWFLEMYVRCLENSKATINKAIFIGKFYHYYKNISLNNRQRKVVNKLLECFPEEFMGDLTNKKYVAITKVSPETAKRDLKYLLDNGIIISNNKSGRSTGYKLNRNI